MENFEVFKKNILDEILSVVKERLTQPDMGFQTEYKEKYDMPWFDVCSEKTIHISERDDEIRIEIGAELGYSGMEKISDVLNPIIQKYDSNSYFDMEDAGLMLAVLDKEKVLDYEGDYDYEH